MSAEQKAKQLGLELGAGSPAIGNYVAAVTTGSLIYISGQVPIRPDGSPVVGKVGEDVTVEEAYEAARIATVGLLTRVRAEAGSLDRVKRVVKLTGFVNAATDFTQHPQVVNGASDLLAAVFGDKGLHARAAVGVSSLPLGVPVEVEMIVEVE
jgi:enamine deaminase RidA (YjgF/YER057c/UK114 family)